MYSRCDKKSVIPIAIFDQFAYFIYIQSMCNSTQNAHKHLARITNDRAKFNILLVCPAKYSVSHINTTQHALIVPRDRSARVSSARATLYMCHRIIWHAFDDTPKIFNRTPSRTNSNSITCDVLASTLVRASHPRCARALGMREPLISRTVCCALYFVRKWQVASCLSTAVYLCVCVCVGFAISSRVLCAFICEHSDHQHSDIARACPTTARRLERIVARNAFLCGCTKQCCALRCCLGHHSFHSWSPLPSTARLVRATTTTISSSKEAITREVRAARWCTVRCADI